MVKFEETKSFFEKQIDNFIMKDDFSETFKNIDDQLESFQKVIFEQSKEGRKLKEEIRGVINILNKKSEKTRVESEFKRLWSNFSKYWAYQHLDHFRNEINPMIDNCKINTNKCIAICEENKSMIRRFDEVMCDKASRFSIIKLYKGKFIQLIAIRYWSVPWERKIQHF